MEKLPMENYKELYVLDRPIITRIGNAHFLRVSEYPELIQYTPYLNIEKFEFVNSLRDEKVMPFLKQTIFTELDDDSIKLYLDTFGFIELIKHFKDIFEIYNKLKELFILIFKKDVIDLIQNDEEFEAIRSLIKDMNHVVVEKKNPNPEIQRFIDMKKELDRKKNGDLNFESIYSSVYLEIGKEIEELSIFNLYVLFNRISSIKANSATTLFATVAEKVNIESWCKPMKSEESEDNISMNELKDKIGM